MTRRLSRRHLALSGAVALLLVLGATGAATPTLEVTQAGHHMGPS